MQTWEDTIKFTRGEEIWTRLVEHLENDRGPLILTLASVDGDLRPQLRSLVLRKIDAVQKQLYFYTDMRSTKVAEWTKNSFCQALYYDSNEQLQLRLSGQVKILTEGKHFEHEMAQVRPHQFRDYSATIAPGKTWSKEALEQNQELHFALIELSVSKIEALLIGQGGKPHLRYEFIYDAKGNYSSARRLVP